MNIVTRDWHVQIEDAHGILPTDVVLWHTQKPDDWPYPPEMQEMDALLVAHHHLGQRVSDVGKYRMHVHDLVTGDTFEGDLEIYHTPVVSPEMVNHPKHANGMYYLIRNHSFERVTHEHVAITG